MSNKEWIIALSLGLLLACAVLLAAISKQPKPIVPPSPFQPVWTSSNSAVTLFVERVNINGINYLVSSKGGIIKE